jgi:hypothetical protein
VLRVVRWRRGGVWWALRMRRRKWWCALRGSDAVGMWWWCSFVALVQLGCCNSEARSLCICPVRTETQRVLAIALSSYLKSICVLLFLRASFRVTGDEWRVYGVEVAVAETKRSEAVVVRSSRYICRMEVEAIAGRSKVQGCRACTIVQVSRRVRDASQLRLGLKFRNHEGWSGKAGKRRWLVGPRQQHNTTCIY